MNFQFLLSVYILRTWSLLPPHYVTKVFLNLTMGPYGSIIVATAPSFYPSSPTGLQVNFLCVCIIQGGSNMTGTDLCVNKCKQSRSYLNHLVHSHGEFLSTLKELSKNEENQPGRQIQNLKLLLDFQISFQQAAF